MRTSQGTWDDDCRACGPRLGAVAAGLAVLYAVSGVALPAAELEWLTRRAPELPPLPAVEIEQYAVTPDGRYVAFSSTSGAAVPGQVDHNGGRDIFWLDRETGEARVVSRSAADPFRTADAASQQPQISDDGHTVAFLSSASDLVPAQDNARRDSQHDVYVYRVETGEVSLASGVHGSPTQTSGAVFFSRTWKLSVDGEVVAFQADVEDIAPDDEPAPFDREIFAFERATGQRQLTEDSAYRLSGSDFQSDGWLVLQVGDERNLLNLSSGAVVETQSTCDLLVGAVFYGCRSDFAGIWRIDLSTGVQTQQFGSAPISGEIEAVLDASAFGLKLLLRSTDDNLYLYDTTTLTATLLTGSASAPGTPSPPGPTSLPTVGEISPDGTELVFQAHYSDFVEGQIDPDSPDDLFHRDIFHVDLESGERTLVSWRGGVLEASGEARDLRFVESSDESAEVLLRTGHISEDGANVVAGLPGTTASPWRTLASVTVAGGAASLPEPVARAVPDDEAAAGRAGGPVVSGDGRFVAYSSRARDLVPGITSNGRDQVYVHDRWTGETQLVSHAWQQPSVAGNRDTGVVRISGDGRYLLLLGIASDLAEDELNPRGDIGCSRYGSGCVLYHYDQATRQARVVVSDVRFDLPKYTDYEMSEDGRTVVFTESGEVIEGQTAPAAADIFIWDADTGETRLVTHVPGDPLTPSQARVRSRLDLSPEGSVLFFQTATFGPATGPDSRWLYRWQRSADRIVAIARVLDPSDDPQAQAEGDDLAAIGRNLTAEFEFFAPRRVSRHGSRLLFVSRSAELTPDFANPDRMPVLYSFEAVTASFRPLVVAAEDQALVLERVQVSEDGRYATFPDGGGRLLMDLVTGATVPVEDGVFSSDFRRQISTGSGDLVQPVVTSSGEPLFATEVSILGLEIGDLAAGSPDLLTRSVADPNLAGVATAPDSSASGRVVAFENHENLLFEGDLGGHQGIYVSRADECSGSEACLSERRYSIVADWRDGSGNSGIATASALPGVSTSFWFFEEDNTELFVKVLDGCGFNGRQWVFAAGLTDVAVNLTVTDTWTGQFKRYRSRVGESFGPRLDTVAFDGCHLDGSWREPVDFPEPPEPSYGQIVELEGGAFAVSAEVTLPAGVTAAQGYAQNENSSLFWFLEPGNLELAIKVLDGCAINGHRWVFAAGLTDLPVRFEVRDAATNGVRTYEQEGGAPFRVVRDVEAFPCG